MCHKPRVLHKILLKIPLFLKEQYCSGVSSDSMELYSGGIWTKLELKLSSGVHNHCGVTIRLLIITFLNMCNE